MADRLPGAEKTPRERQALVALLLPSANSIAALLAVHEAGSVEAFVVEMNEAAAELGMGDTHYTDPSGFEDTTVSTAADQLKLARAAMADPTSVEIVAMPSAWLPAAASSSPRRLRPGGARQRQNLAASVAAALHGLSRAQLLR